MLNLLQKRKVYLVYIPLILYWIVLLTATSIPLKHMPSLNVGDKAVHFFAYFVLAVLLYLTLIYQRKSIILFKYATIFTILIIAIYGALDEIHQMYIPGRSMDYYDWLADIAGGIIALVMIKYVAKKLNYGFEWN